jgi:transposase-like protein
MNIKAGNNSFCKQFEMVHKLNNFQRLILVKKALKDKENLTDLCRKLKISRTLAYRLIHRYINSSGKLASIVSNNVDKNCVQEVSEMRLYILDKVLIEGRSISGTCKEFGISRTIFYRWLSRYKNASYENKLASLEDKKIKSILLRSKPSDIRKNYAD